MEESGGLDASNNIDLFCLHKVFLQLIQNDLDVSQQGWNRHRIRTARKNRTPNLLFVEGLQYLSHYSEVNNVHFIEIFQVLISLERFAIITLISSSF